MQDEKKVKVVIFDFDGTLVDIQTIFFQILNTLAPLYHFPSLSEEEIPKVRKMSARELVFDYLKIAWWRIPLLERRARAEYLKRIQDVKLFPGIKNLLQDLHVAGYEVGILSSSTEEFITTFLHKENIPVDFVVSSSIFGKARALKKLLKQKGLSPTEVVYVGDEMRDVEACQKNQVAIFAAGWGLNDPERLKEVGANQVCASPQELREMLLN